MQLCSNYQIVAAHTNLLELQQVLNYTHSIVVADNDRSTANRLPSEVGENYVSNRVHFRELPDLNSGFAMLKTNPVYHHR